MTAAEIIQLLGLQPHPKEGGHFVETYRSPHSTAIYYLLTPATVSAMHRLNGDELFHFYAGDPVEMLHLFPDGTGHTCILGADLAAGQRPQIIVPGGVWQGARLVAGGQWALLGTTMAPGFAYADYETGPRAALVRHYPSWRELITALTTG